LFRIIFLVLSPNAISNNQIPIIIIMVVPPSFLINLKVSFRIRAWYASVLMSIVACSAPLNTSIVAPNVTALGVGAFFAVNGGGIVALHRISHYSIGKIRLNRCVGDVTGQLLDNCKGLWLVAGGVVLKKSDLMSERSYIYLSISRPHGISMSVLRLN
jgi:hypothetical protein